MVSNIKVLRNSVGYVHFITANSHPHSGNTELLVGHMRRCVEEFQVFDVQKNISSCVCVCVCRVTALILSLLNFHRTLLQGAGFRSHPPTLRNITNGKKIHKIQLKTTIFIKDSKVTCEFYVLLTVHLDIFM